MYAITKTVKKHRLTEVKQLQALLHILGYSIPVDNVLNSDTEEATEKFQKKQNIKERKQVTKETWLILYKTFNHFMHRLCDDSKSLNARGCEIFNTHQSPFITIDSNTENTVIVTWLQVLLYLLDNNTRITGIFDAVTAEKIKHIQRKYEIIEDGTVNNATWQALFTEGAHTANIVANLFLTDAYIEHKAKQENIDVAIIKTLLKVEASESGFYPSCHPKLSFEGHKFWKQLEQQGVDAAALQKNNQDILYPTWTTTFYTGSGQGEYQRLKHAKTIHEEAALNSASWGMFQIMGSNAKACGFDDVKSFIASISEGEHRQLDAFFAFLHHEELIEVLKNKDWETFARRYNGTQFRKNGYDAKLQISFERIQHRSCAKRSELSDTLIIAEYTHWLEEAFTEFTENTLVH